jgi:hypothetical protein
MVSRLDGAEDIDRGNIGARECTIMHHLLDARASRSDLGCQISQTARSIANYGGESAEASVRDETTFDYATEHVGIDVAAAKQKDYSFAHELF